MKINLITGSDPSVLPHQLQAEFRHFRRYNDQNEICERGGHTSMSFMWNNRLITIVTRCSLKDKFSKKAARLVCIQKALKIIFDKPRWIESCKSQKELMEIWVTDVEQPRYWWIAKARICKIKKD